NQIYYSPRWKSIFGYEDTEIGDSPSEWFDRVHPNDLVLLKHNFSQHMEGQVDHFHCEFRGLTKSGDMRWFLARGITECQPCSTPTRIAGSLTDITERKVVEERLRHDAMHDPVTGLNNRIFFVEQLKRASEHGNRREDYLSAVLFMDLDRFKMVNDGLGHSAGDRLLMAFGQRLLECVRFGDSVARFGGDEFIILLDDIHNVQDTLRVVERIQQKLLQPFYLDQHEVTLTASIGITLVSDGLARAEDILRDAATAMHQAKANGRACYQIFDGEMHAHSLEQLQMEAELRRAVEHHEFEVYYQPVISLASGSITAVEALVRWPHPRLGLIPPDQFIPLAEETGLISQIDEWVLRTACEQMQTWRSQGNPDLSVAVNVSASELSDDRLPAFLEKVLDETGLPAEGLQIEVTESASMKNIDHTIQIFNKLHSMGISISIDDFGTSYSSLAYLKRFPIQTIKVDRIFIKDVPNRDEDAILASAILSMGHILGLKVIAEGIENEAQLRFLHYQGCDEVQGYLFSPPRPAREIEIQLKKSYLFDEQFS
ncbi:MAG: EAL domain-containing protein, partial [Chloroflexi bacterium]|nr:EAL domain-containing protein [Chloroflexota bacterium]